MSTTQTMVVTSDSSSTKSYTMRRPRSFVMISPRKAVSSFIRRSPSSLEGQNQKRRSVSAPLDKSPVASPLRNVVSSDSARSANLSTVHAHQPKHSTLSFPAVADLFIKLRRVQTKAKKTRASREANANGDSTGDILSGEKGKQRVKPNHAEFSSGPVLLTHPVIVPEDDKTSMDGVEVVKRARLTIRDTYDCSGGVDSIRLLRASRSSLLEKAEMFQTNALVEEEWSCCISTPRKGGNGVHYRVQVSLTVIPCYPGN